ncbi:MAG: aspartyl protease family protein [Acidobacteria bacterium]|nr:aspartyl protease family protein [Acidobacteriota bacterium]
MKFTIRIFLFIIIFCSFAKAQELVEIIYHQRLIFAELVVNECDKAVFLIDTGAIKSAIDIKSAERLRLIIAGESRVEGSAGEIDVKNARLNTLSLGSASVSNLEVSAYDLSGVLAPPEKKVDGILGYDFLRYFSVEIDYKKQKIMLRKIPKKKLDFQTAVPFNLDNNIPRIKGILNGNVKADFRLDTGASLFETDDVYLNTTEGVWDQLKRSDPTLKPETYFTGSGVGGSVKLPVAKIKSLSIGRVTNRKVYVIVQPKAGYFARKDAVGFISNNFLEKYSPVTIDYKTKRILLTTIEK